MRVFYQYATNLPLDAVSVIPDAHLWCHHGDEETLFIEGVRLYWLPFVVTDSGLLAGIFLSSCRNLALREHGPQANHEYSQLAMMYKLECIRSVNEAIAAEGPTITETTIAKTLLLCADEVSQKLFLKCQETVSNKTMA